MHDCYANTTALVGHVYVQVLLRAGRLGRLDGMVLGCI